MPSREEQTGDAAAKVEKVQSTDGIALFLCRQVSTNNGSSHLVDLLFTLPPDTPQTQDLNVTMFNSSRSECTCTVWIA